MAKKKFGYEKPVRVVNLVDVPNGQLVILEDDKKIKYTITMKDFKRCLKIPKYIKVEYSNIIKGCFKIDLLEIREDKKDFVVSPYNKYRIKNVYPGTSKKPINLYDYDETKPVNSYVVAVFKNFIIVSVPALSVFVRINSGQLFYDKNENLRNDFSQGQKLHLFVSTKEYDGRVKKYLSPVGLKDIRTVMFDELKVGKVYKASIIDIIKSKDPSYNSNSYFAVLNNGLTIVVRANNEITLPKAQVYVEIISKKTEGSSVLGKIINLP